MTHIQDSRIGTAKKVLEYLQKNKQASPTQITKDLEINFYAVKSCLDFLQEIRKIELITNGNISLAKIVEGKNDNK